MKRPFMGKNRKKLLQFLRPDPPPSSSSSDSDSNDDAAYSPPSTSSALTSPPSSPYAMSSPWTQLPGLGPSDDTRHQQQQQLLSGTTTTGLLGSLVKEDGHVYSLAAAGDLLYTGTDSPTVRVWRDRNEIGGFRSGSGLVKAVVVADDGRIYTGHQDGKVRVWRRGGDDGEGAVRHRRVGTLPRVRDAVAGSLLPSRYGHTRLRPHLDAVSCLSLDAAAGLLYSGSWDRTVKVWRVSDSRCVESVSAAHDDAVNAVAAAGFDALLFTGSADGTVKVWRRHQDELDHDRGGVISKGRSSRTRHEMERVLRRGDGAVTAIAVAAEARVVYVGSSDGAVTHWQFPLVVVDGGGGASTPRNGGALRGHGTAAVLCLAVAREGRVVVSGSADRTVVVWRRQEGPAGAEHARLAVLRGHTGPVKCVATDAEEDGNGDGVRRWVVYSGSLDGSVKVWRVSDCSSVTHQTRKGAAPLVRSWNPPYAAAAAPERDRMAPA